MTFCYVLTSPIGSPMGDLFLPLGCSMVRLVRRLAFEPASDSRITMLRVHDGKNGKTQQQCLFCCVFILRYNVTKKERKRKIMMYEVVGYERRKGDKSKKTGKPYDIRVFHCIDKVPYTKSAEFGGCKVEQIVFNLLNCTEDVRQRVLDVDVGSNINVYFNRAGFAESLEAVTD